MRTYKYSGVSCDGSPKHGNMHECKNALLYRIFNGESTGYMVFCKRCATRAKKIYGWKLKQVCEFKRVRGRGW